MDKEKAKLKREEKHIENYNSERLNKFWLWGGVLILIALLIWFIFFLGFTGEANLVNNG